MGWLKRRALVGAVALATLAGACAPASGPAPGTIIGAPAPSAPVATTTTRRAADQRAGAQMHQRILAEFGGAYANGRIERYVDTLGRRVAAVTEQPDEPWTFTVLDSPVVNAFALPSGHVYVTRGLLALANDEAELASVIGHEIGHVTANHAMQRQSRAAAAQLGVLAVVLGAAVLGADPEMLDMIGTLGGAAGQGVVASFSRAQELEADLLGVRYVTLAGYDPAGQADFLRNMQASATLQARLAGGRYDAHRVDFFATHPATAERIANALAAARAEGPGGERARNRTAFLDAVEGMTFGDSRAQGFVRGQRFVHPDLRFAFSAPAGFTLSNSPAAVTARGASGAQVVFDGAADPGGSLEAYLLRDWLGALAAQTRIGQPAPVERFRVGDLEAAQTRVAVPLRGGQGVAVLTAVRGNGRIWRFFGVADQRDRAGLQGIDATARSFRTLSAAEAAAQRPWRIATRTVRPGETAETLAAAMPMETARADWFRVLNGLEPGAQPAAGRRVTLVVE